MHIFKVFLREKIAVSTKQSVYTKYISTFSQDWLKTTTKQTHKQHGMATGTWANEEQRTRGNSTDNEVLMA
jgi:hypothetical protein